MDASKKTIENLILSAAVATQELYTTILEDAAVLEACDERVPSLLRCVPELRMDVKFILVDLQTIIRACFVTEKAYEKRYHLKNLYAGMLEGYKLLYGFGSMRRRTVWARIGEELNRLDQDNPDMASAFEPLKLKYDAISQQLLAIEATNTDRDDRNLTYHYDDDLLLVYRLTLRTDSEEKASLKYIEFVKILGAMLQLGNQIELTEAVLGHTLPQVNAHHDDVALNAVKIVAETLGKHPQLPEALSVAVDKGASQLDSFAKYKKDVVTVEKRVGEITNNEFEIPEFDVIKALLDIQMLVPFMMADMAAILRGFVGAGSKAEYPLILRKMTISRVSTLSHLIGYGNDGADSMWSGIISVIPRDSYELQEEAEKIEIILKGIRKPDDCDRRALYVHLIDNKTYDSNVPVIVQKMEDITILSELQDSQEIIKICGRISQFVAKLMTVLSENARKSRIQSEQKLKKQMSDIRKMADRPNVPKVLRDTIRKHLDEIEPLMFSEDS